MIITNHRIKIINAIVYFANNTKYCGKTKLLKLLYFLDFRHFKETGKSVTGLDYYAWNMGPVPKDVYEELSGKMKPDLKQAIQDFRKSRNNHKPIKAIILTHTHSDHMSGIEGLFDDGQVENVDIYGPPGWRKQIKSDAETGQMAVLRRELPRLL